MLQEAKLPLWLRPFEVLVTSSRTALIEMIPDTLSIHALKARSHPNMSLRSHFYAKFVRVSCCQKPQCNSVGVLDLRGTFGWRQPSLVMNSSKEAS